MWCAKASMARASNALPKVGRGRSHGGEVIPEVALIEQRHQDAQVHLDDACRRAGHKYTKTLSSEDRRLVAMQRSCAADCACLEMPETFTC